MKNYIFKKLLLSVPLFALALFANSATCPDGVTITNITGTGTACGQVTLTANGTGGSGSLVYSWNTGNSAGSQVNNFTTTGTYTVSVTVSDGNSCTATASQSITVKANPSPGITGTTPNCGSVTLTGTGGSSYAWSGGGSGTSNTYTTSGTYTVSVTVTGSNSCSATTSESITVNSIPAANATGNAATCSPVQITATGGGTYAWSGGNNPTSATNSVTSTNTYTVTVTGSDGCSATASVSQTVNFGPSALITPGGAARFCSGGTLLLTAPSSGDALTFSGGTVTTTAAANLGTGDFTVEAWIYPTASTQGTIVVQTGSGLGFNFYVNGNGSGSFGLGTINSGTESAAVQTSSGVLTLNQWEHIAATVSGGVAVLYLDGVAVGGGTFTSSSLTNTTLSIGNDGLSNPFTGSIDELRLWNIALNQVDLESSIYSIIPYNSVGLVDYYRFDEGSNTTVNDYATGGATGTLSSNITWQVPSTAPVGENIGQSILYNWSTGGVSQAVEITTGGSYVVKVTNATVNSCFSTDTFVVIVDTLPVASVDSVGSFCPGSSLTLGATGGSTYAWSGPNGFTLHQQDSTFNVATINSGEYTVTATTGNGCTATAYRNITVYSAPVAAAVSTSPQCVGSTLGLNSSGGLFYAWSGPNSFHSSKADTSIVGVTSAASGTYTVTVTDANGCTASASTAGTINSPPSAAATVAIGTVCAGSSLNFTATGGLYYLWSGPNNFQSNFSSDSVTDASTEASGTYSVTVTDIHGCSATASVSATVDSVPTVEIGSNSPLCVGITLSLTGGPSSEASYAWSGPGFTSEAQDTSITGSVTGGTYELTVTDGNGCSASAATSVTVNSPPASPSASNSGPVCAGSSLTLISSSADSYVWSGPNGFSSTQQDPVIGTAVTADSGTYTVTVTTSGCSATASTTASVNTSPVATATNNTVGTQCAGENIYLAATGGATYNWSGPIGFQRYQQNDTIIAAGAAATGTYYVTVTDANGCSSTASTTLTIIDVPAVTVAGLNDTVCAGETLELTATGGTTYTWTGPNNFTSTAQDTSILHVTSAAAGTYTVAATNSGGCTSTASTTIAINVLPVITSCPGNMVVNETPGLCSAVVPFTVTATGTPAADLWYSQNPGTVFVPGVTTVLVNASNTCGSATCTFTVTVVDNQPPAITCPSNITILATEATDNSVLSIPVPVVSDNCGVASVVNSFNGTGNASGTYYPGTTNVVWTVTDINGNSSTCTQTVVVYPNLVLSGTANNTLCPGTYFGSVTTLVAGGQSPYHYLWSNGSTATGLSNLAAGNYTLTVTDAASNTVSETFTVETFVPVNQPATPGGITGTAYVCSGSVNTYSIAAVPNAVSYLWTVPGGATIVSGQGTTQVSVKFPATSCYGNLQVSAVNCIGGSSNAVLSVNTISVPSRPSSISGSSYVCAAGAIYTYSVASATSNYPVTYTWTTPTNASIVTGQGTNVVTVKFATGYTTGSLSVIASDCAGSSSATTLTVAVSTHAPTALNDIDVYSPNGDVEPSAVCPGDTVSYTVNQDVPQQYVASYNWTAPANAVIVSGQGTQVVTVAFLHGYTGGNLTVYGSNCTGNSATWPQSIPVNTSVPGTPCTPYSLTSNTTNTACPGDTLVYTASANNARSYTWTVPANTVLVSGQGTNTIKFVVQPAFSSGNVSVYASNCAGNGNSNSQFIDISNPPGAPCNLQGPSAVCNGIAYNYTVGAASGLVESYVWTVPTGATIISGQGTTSISVSYQSGFTGGSVSVVAANCIVNSNAATISVSPQTSVPGPWDSDDPINYTDGDEIAGVTNQCIGDTGTYIANYPANASTLTWTVPAGTSIVSGQGTTSLTIAFITGYTGGTLSAIASNCIGNSVAATFRLTHTNCGIHDPTTIEEVSASDFDVTTYPNPFNGQFYLKVTTAGSEPVDMKIFDITGKVVEESNNISYTEEVALGSRLESGVYLVEVKQGDNTKVIRVVKAE